MDLSSEQILKEQILGLNNYVIANVGQNVGQPTSLKIKCMDGTFFYDADTLAPCEDEIAKFCNDSFTKRRDSNIVVMLEQNAGSLMISLFKLGNFKSHLELTEHIQNSIRLRESICQSATG